jgi:hypothetical protein
MVTLLRTHDAPPLWCAGHVCLPSPRVRRKAGGSGDAIQKWWHGGKVRALVMSTPEQWAARIRYDGG